MFDIVFLGTPEFAVPPLEALLQKGYNIKAVITQPDREKNRRGELLPTPVKLFAQKAGLPVYQFEKIKREGAAVLKPLSADFFITAAYGQILSQEILDIPKYGTLNIHASLLPAYRGSAPVQWCLIKGEKKTGITIMRIDIGVDTGDIMLQKELDILPEEDAGSLMARLSVLGASAITEALKLFADGKITFIPQDSSFATHYPMIRKVDGELDFSLSAEEICNKVRGLNPNPGCYTFLDNMSLKVHRAKVIENSSVNSSIGEVVTSDLKDGITVLCGKGSVRLAEIQLSGGKRMADTEFLKGRKIPVGSIFVSGL